MRVPPFTTGGDRPRLFSKINRCPLLLLATGGVTGIFLFVRAMQTQKEPLVVAYERLCRKLAKSGIKRATHEGPMDYWKRLRQLRPDIAQQAAPLIERYINLRYAAQPGGQASGVRDFAWSVWRFRLS